MDAREISKQLQLDHFKHPDKFGEWLGYSILSFDKDTSSAESKLDIRKDHLSPAGRVHGGVISGFFDFACGAAVFTTLTKKEICSTIELKVNYLLPMDLGDELLAKTKVVFRGNKLCVVHGYIYNKGKKAAMASATFNIVQVKDD
jgi:uncharacterized protein (TIGR00369 family)